MKNIGDKMMVKIPGGIKYSKRYAGKTLEGVITQINKVTYEVTIKVEDGCMIVRVPK